MKTSILSALALLTFALCPATAEQDYGTLISNHQITLGMTCSDVFAAWGGPSRIVPSDPGEIFWWYDGNPSSITNGAQWSYNGYILKFENGIFSTLIGAGNVHTGTMPLQALK